jgi:hypothetical protein
MKSNRKDGIKARSLIPEKSALVVTGTESSSFVKRDKPTSTLASELEMACVPETTRRRKFLNSVSLGGSVVRGSVLESFGRMFVMLETDRRSS